MIYITTDDLNPKFLSFWAETFDKLKEEFPQLEVTAFTVPVWENKSVYSLDNSKEWAEWYENHKDWVSIAMHGYHHKRKTSKNKFEGHQSYEQQLELYGKSLDILKPFMPKNWGYKPPYYKWNSATLDALAELDCTWAHLEAKFHWFKKEQIQWYGTILESHINPECTMPDRVDSIMQYFRWILSNQIGNLNDLATGKYGNVLKMYQVTRHVSDRAWLNPSYYIEDEMRWFNERVKLTPPNVMQ